MSNSKTEKQTEQPVMPPCECNGTGRILVQTGPAYEHELDWRPCGCPASR